MPPVNNLHLNNDFEDESEDDFEDKSEDDFEDDSHGPDRWEDLDEEEREGWESYIENLTKDG